MMSASFLSMSRLAERGRKWLRSSTGYLSVLLLLGFLHGILYIYIFPPWQHYDEMNHFEYAWLIANRSILPQAGDEDPGMNRQVLRSMIRNNFFGRGAAKPQLPSEDQTVSIQGFPQFEHPPLYYLAVAVPLRLLSQAKIDTQLYAGRWVSLLFYLLSILAAWGCARECTRPDSPLRWMVPACLVFLPGFVDIMSALNSDTAAIAVFSFFLWGVVRFLRRDFALVNLVWVIAAAVFCYYTKRVVAIAVPVALVAVFLIFVRTRRQVLWACIAGIVLAGILGMAVLRWEDAGLWYRSTLQSQPTRLASEQAVVGKYILQVDAKAMISPPWSVPVFQPLAQDAWEKLRGKTITLAGWMWADRPVQTTTPVLYQGAQLFTYPVALSTQPVFFAFQARAAEISARSYVALFPKNLPAGVKVYYDGLVLAEGAYPLDQEPVFQDVSAVSGQWGGQPFVNLLANGSAEKAGPRFALWMDRLGSRLLPDQTLPSIVLTAFLDWKHSGWYFYWSSVRLLRTFWGQFAWGNVSLLGARPYRNLGILTLILLGLTASIVLKRERGINWKIVLILGLALAGLAFPTLARGVIYLGQYKLYLPVARYILPAVIPIALLLCLGWLQGWYLFQRWELFLAEKFDLHKDLALLERLLCALPGWTFVLCFLILDGIALVSIIRYYQA